MKVAEVMTRDVEVVSPTSTLREAARKMDELNVGVLPVCDGRRLSGVITDRDITVRASAAGESPESTTVNEVMSMHPRWCLAEVDVTEAEQIMAESQIRRLPVVDDEKNLIGIVSLGDLATEEAPGAREALRQVSEPSEPDRDANQGTASGDDHGVRRAVVEAFAARPDLDSSGIHVAVHEGLARLTGTAGSEEDIRRAVEVAGSVQGVSEVRNDIGVQNESTVANQTGVAATGPDGRTPPRPMRNIR